MQPEQALIDFVSLFNSEAYWESHEALESEWRRTRDPFLHGLILYASAWVHRQRGNRHGIVAQLDKAESLLRDFRPKHLGIDIENLLVDATRLRATAGLESAGFIPRLAILPD